MSDAELWDGFAMRYDRVVRLFDTSYGRVRARLSRDIPAGSDILEVAAGTGQFTADLARVAASVRATDLSPEMVARLRTRLDSEGFPDVRCDVASAYAIDPSDSSVDVVFCANALHVMDDPERALAEFRRVLRPGGVLIAPTFLHGAGVLRRVLSRTLSLVSPFVAHSRFELDELEQLITESGFDVQFSEQMPGLFPLGYIVAYRPTGGVE